MTRQEVKTLTTQGGILKVWNDKNGTIWYRYKENNDKTRSKNINYTRRHPKSME
nr:MAG TPA: hypothetical protein [Microviridae sp.]